MKTDKEELKRRRAARGRIWRKTHKELANKLTRDWQKRLIASGSIKYRFSCAKASAKQRKVAFSLTEEQYYELIIQKCHYCERPLSKSGIGLDRINNDKSIGYAIDNVLPCCPECNSIRSNILTVQETEIVIKSLWAYRRTLYDIHNLDSNQEESSYGKTKTSGEVR
jgi:hypothetical protein